MKARGFLVGGYDLILVLGAIVTGIRMLQSKQGVFSEFPEEWLKTLPFDSWVVPGIVAISLFGLGNMVSAVLCIRARTCFTCGMSMAMGLILFLFMIAQITILGEWYLATVQLMIAGLLQIMLGGYAMHRAKQPEKYKGE